MNAICLDFFCCQAKQDRDNTSTLLGATICIFKKPATIDTYYETTMVLSKLSVSLGRGWGKKSRQAPKIANRKKSTILLQSLWNLV